MKLYSYSSNRTNLQPIKHEKGFIIGGGKIKFCWEKNRMLSFIDSALCSIILSEGWWQINGKMFIGSIFIRDFLCSENLAFRWTIYRILQGRAWNGWKLFAVGNISLFISNEYEIIVIYMQVKNLFLYISTMTVMIIKW